MMDQTRTCSATAFLSLHPLRSGLLLLATTYDEHVSLDASVITNHLYPESMPNITRVQKNKQALAGIMRIAPELSLAAWYVYTLSSQNPLHTYPRPGDNMFQCPAEYSCPPPTITIDSFDTFGSRYIDVGAAGPQAFDYDITSNVSWIQISTTHGSISPSNTEERVFLSISDWSKLEAGPNYGGLNFTATATGTGAAKQLVKVLTVPVYMVANNTKATLPSGFKGRRIRVDCSFTFLMTDQVLLRPGV